MSYNHNVSGGAGGSREALQRAIQDLRNELSARGIDQRNSDQEEDLEREYERLRSLLDSASAAPGIVPPGYVDPVDASTTPFATVQPSSQRFPAIHQRASERRAQNEAEQREQRVAGYSSAVNSQLGSIGERQQHRASGQQPSDQRSHRERAAVSTTSQPAAWLSTRDPATAAAGGPLSVTVSQDTLATYHEWIQAGQPTPEQVARGEPGSVQPPPLPPGQQQRDPFGGAEWEMPEEYRVYSSYAADDSMAPPYHPTSRPWDDGEDDDEGAGQV